MSDAFVNSFASKSISSMYLKSEFADVHFTFPNDDQTEKIPAHKNILATVSPVFSRMFYGSLKEGDIAKITDSNASDFKQFLQFIYLPEITFTMDNIEEIVRLADKYDMLNNVDACIPFLESQLTNENVAMVYQLAIFLENTKLKEFCEKLIRVFIKDVLKSEAFLECEQKVVKHILQMDMLACCEGELFTACIKWACRRNEFDVENLRSLLGDSFYLIRFGAMDAKTISIILANKEFRELFTHDELADFFQTKMDKTFQSVIFKHAKRTTPPEIELTCGRNCMSGTLYLKSQESAWFSANKPIRLKCIYFGVMVSSIFCMTSFNSNVEIIEYNTNTFPTNSPPKTLYTHRNLKFEIEFGVPRLRLSLHSPITINPRKLYEIRMVDAPRKYYYGDTSVRASEIKLNDQITIKFHHDPLDNDSWRRNLVTKLIFLQF